MKSSKKQYYKETDTLGTVEKIKTPHEEIAEMIINSLESNQIPWKKPWKSVNPQNLFSKKDYRGINHFLLSMLPVEPFFATFNQVRQAGGMIKAGSKSVPVFFYSPITKNKGEENESSYWLMKKYRVFSIDQIEGIEFKNFIDPEIDFQPVLKAENLVEAFTGSQGLKILNGSGAAYNPLEDYLIMPKKERFFSEDAYYSTIFHEMIHSTGSEKRLKRDGFDPGSFHRFGSKGYAFEELVAEFGAAMLSTYCGVNTSLEEGQSTAYIKGWLKVIKEDPSICYKAASKAQSAVDFILKESGFNAFGETSNEETGE